MSMWSRHHAWTQVLPPSRPTPQELTRVRDVISTFRNPRVAVMGSTPEFRTICGQMLVTGVVTIDNSLEFHESVDPLVTTRPTSERFVHTSWQRFFLETDDLFDLILSDLTLGNIPYEERPQLFRDIHRTLKRGGYFIDKVLTNEGRPWDAEDIGRKYAALPLNLETVNAFNCEAIFCGTHSVNGVLNAAHAYDNLEQQLGHCDHPASLIRECELITPRHMLWYYGLPWSDVDKYYAHGLSRVARFSQEAQSPYLHHAYQFFNHKL